MDTKLGLHNESNVFRGFQYNGNVLMSGIQRDGSMIDIEGNIMSSEERQKIIKSIHDLPIHNKAGIIRDAVHDSIITVIDAKTGSGKTTEVPKLLDGNIVVSEPRVIAAIAAANRVSKGLLATTGDPYYSIGHKVGYRTGREVNSSYASELLYVTDGLQLLRQFVSDIRPDILIMDEVHTYSIPTEWVLKLMKDFMKEQMKKNVKDRTKLILMSATLDHDMIKDYFKDISSNIEPIKVEGRQFNITKEYKTGKDFVSSILNSAYQKRDVLAFVEGKKEIATVIEELEMSLSPDEYDIFPLHSELPIEEQHKLLSKQGDKTTIIVATNVAQESLTIPYISDVVDNGYRKVLKINSAGVPELRREVISKADSDQRAGRSGRVKEGGYIFANGKPFEDLKDFPDGEIENVTLEKYILISLSVGFDPLKEYRKEFSKDEKLRDKIFIHEPNIDLVKLSYINLLRIGAIDGDLNKDTNIVQNATLTKLGRELLNFPLDPSVGKMLKESIRLGCTGEMIDICAIINHKGFLGKNQDWQPLVNGRLKKNSDLIAQREIFKFITTKEPLNEHDVKYLLKKGISNQELNLYKEYSNNGKEKMLFEIVDLTEIGIKSKRISEILNTIKILKERLESDRVEIKYADYRDSTNFSTACSNIIECMLHGIPNNIFECCSEDGKNFHHEEMEFFIKPNTSTITAVEGKKYIGFPFIIGGVGDNQDMPLLLFISEVDEALLNEVIYTHENDDFKDLQDSFKMKQVKNVKKKSRKLEPRILANLKNDHGGLNRSDMINGAGNDKLSDFYSFKWVPDYLIKNNPNYKKIINSYNDKAKGEFNVQRFVHILSLFNSVFKEYGKGTREDIHNFFDNDKTILDNIIRKSRHPSVIEFFSNPYKTQYETINALNPNRRSEDSDIKRFEEIGEEYERNIQLDKKIEKERKKPNKGGKLNMYISKIYKISKTDAKLLIDKGLIVVNNKNTYYLQEVDTKRDELDIRFKREQLPRILKFLKNEDNATAPLEPQELQSYLSSLYDISIDDANLLIDNDKLKVNGIFATSLQIFNPLNDELITFFEKHKIPKLIKSLKNEVDIETGPQKLQNYVGKVYSISTSDARLLIDNKLITVNKIEANYLQLFDPQKDKLDVSFDVNKITEIIESLKTRW